MSTVEVEKVSSVINNSRSKDEDDDVPLPGFRFHPTDEELVGFYLRRKVEKRPISIELIKQIDIYKHDPWDLPKASNSVGEKEGYFFCKRGRKYRNSIRPNRVTGSGFWKATGIDRPIYVSAAAAGEIDELGPARDCIGLKKSLVYYRGSAGKGTKTDWMMHEFRLPAHHDCKSTKHIDAKAIAQEAEVWTLCRIFKRNVSYRKCIPDGREVSAPSAKRTNHLNPSPISDASSKTCSFESDHHPNMRHISFTATAAAPPPVPVLFRHIKINDKKLPFANHHQVDISNLQHQQMMMMLDTGHENSVSHHQAPSSSSTHHHHAAISDMSNASFATHYSDITDFLKHGEWDELRSVVELGLGAAPNFLL